MRTSYPDSNSGYLASEATKSTNFRKSTSHETEYNNCRERLVGSLSSLGDFIKLLVPRQIVKPAARFEVLGVHPYLTTAQKYRDADQRLGIGESIFSLGELGDLGVCHRGPKSEERQPSVTLEPHAPLLQEHAEDSTL